MYVHPTFSPGTWKQTDMNNTSRLLSAHWQSSMPDLSKDEHKNTYNLLHLQFSFPNSPTLIINSYSFLFPTLTKSARAIIIIIIQRHKKRTIEGKKIYPLSFSSRYRDGRRLFRQITIWMQLETNAQYIQFQKPTFSSVRKRNQQKILQLFLRSHQITFKKWRKKYAVNFLNRPSDKV